MKTLHIAIIIVVSITVPAITIAMLTNSIPQNQILVYQYVIHEPYQGVENDHGTVIIQNQTFHVANLDRVINKSRPIWVEMYNVNFSFPNGIETQNTPSGQIFETYVTFPDNPVPYRLGIGLGPSPNSPNYEYNTVLSTHKEPQAGFTMHDGSIQLLVNWSKIHANITVHGFNDTYQIGQPIDFQIEVNGFDNFNMGATPDVSITNTDGVTVWQEPQQLVLCCPGKLTVYDKTFSLSNLGGPVIINKTGTYDLMIEYNHRQIQKQFTIMQNHVTGINDAASPLSAIYPTRCEYYANNTICHGLSMMIDDQNRNYDESPIYDYLNRPVEMDNVTFLYTGSSTPEKDKLNCYTEFPRAINVTFGHHPPIVVFDGYYKVNETRHFAVRLADGTTNSTTLCWIQFTKPRIIEMKDTGLGGVPSYNGMKITWLDKNKTAAIVQHQYQTEDYYNAYIAEVRK